MDPQRVVGTEEEMTTAGAAVDTAYGCPLPGYKPGVGMVPGAILHYALPYQAEGETRWSLLYDDFSGPILDDLGYTPIALPEAATTEEPPACPPP